MTDDQRRLAAVQVGDLLELLPVTLDHLGTRLATLEARIEGAGVPLVRDGVDPGQVEGLTDAASR